MRERPEAPDAEPTNTRGSLYGALATKATRTFATNDEFEAAIDEAWTYAAREAEGEEIPE